MELDFEEIQKIYDVLKNASSKYEVKVFNPWESDTGKEYITIKLKKKE